MKLETMLEKAKAISPDFGRYADYMLTEHPTMNMPTLKDCYRCNASALEYRLHIERAQRGAAQEPKP